jgi:hypothetical protein
MPPPTAHLTKRERRAPAQMAAEDRDPAEADYRSQLHTRVATSLFPPDGLSHRIVGHSPELNDYLLQPRESPLGNDDYR